MSDTPLVSVVLNTYNRADLLMESVASVLAQDYPNFEVIIVDDCSQDNTPEVVAGIVAEHPDRVRSIRLPGNGGLAAARNVGIRAARGELIAFQDDDDLWLPGKLTAQVEALRRHPECGLCYGKALVGTAQGKTSGAVYGHTGMGRTGDNFGLVLRWGAIVLPSAVARKEALLAAGLFKDQLRAGEDTDLLLRLTAHVPAVYLDRPVLVVRQHTGRKTGEEARTGADAEHGLVVFSDLWEALPPAREKYRGLVAARLAADSIRLMQARAMAAPATHDLVAVAQSHPEWFAFREALWVLANAVVGGQMQQAEAVDVLAAAVHHLPGSPRSRRQRMAMFYGVAARRAVRVGRFGHAARWIGKALWADPWFFRRERVTGNP